MIAAVAQSVERRIGSAEVTGPIPVSSFFRSLDYSGLLLFLWVVDCVQIYEFVTVFVTIMQNGLQSPEKPMNQPFIFICGSFLWKAGKFLFISILRGFP